MRKQKIHTNEKFNLQSKIKVYYIHISPCATNYCTLKQNQHIFIHKSLTGVKFRGAPTYHDERIFQSLDHRYKINYKIRAMDKVVGLSENDAT